MSVKQIDRPVLLLIRAVMSCDDERCMPSTDIRQFFYLVNGYHVKEFVINK